MTMRPASFLSIIGLSDPCSSGASGPTGVISAMDFVALAAEG